MNTQSEKPSRLTQPHLLILILFVVTVRVVPVHQIHGLDPSRRPRAWLDVMASVYTTPEEQMEAMEEILILSKDKKTARFLLDEGILDSLLFIVTKYFDQQSKQQQSPSGGDRDRRKSSHSKRSSREHSHAKLAANCCITLGKAHCAAVHTEGDLLLMSLYERGSVPEERQLAQMLYEVPHHVVSSGAGSDTFLLQQASMPKEEEMSKKIKQLAMS